MQQVEPITVRCSLTGVFHKAKAHYGKRVPIRIVLHIIRNILNTFKTKYVTQPPHDLDGSFFVIWEMEPASVW